MDLTVFQIANKADEQEHAPQARFTNENQTEKDGENSGFAYIKDPACKFLCMLYSPFPVFRAFNKK